MTKTRKTPGTYITEISAFPPSVVGVATAIPAFIGYTAAIQNGAQSYLNVPVQISSLADFESYYGYHSPSTSDDTATYYSPQYYLVQQKSKPTTGDYVSLNGVYYSIVSDPSTIYYLYNNIKLFYQNGGGQAYIVSVGAYGPSSKTPMQPGGQIINPNVKLSELLAGLKALENEQAPTMYICPDATLLSVADNGTLMQAMLSQCSTLQSAISIFDVIGGRNPDPKLYTNDIATFRANTGKVGLDYGAAYYPFIGTSVMQSTDINYTNLFGGDTTKLLPLLNPANNPNPAAAAILNRIQKPSGTPLSVPQNNNALLAASPTYTTIMKHVLADANILPASGAMAGIITVTDNTNGPWQAPANTGIIGAVSLPIQLNDTQQANLNVDAQTGESINAIRFFNGQGILVWGARTLDGNSQDWRYISVRRTAIQIEQSIKMMLQGFVFEPNDATTWTSIRSMISNFLTDIWKQGGLVGATSSDAFSVACGLGTSMSPDDILNNILAVSIQVALVHPAEFIVIDIQQQMQNPS